MKEATSRPPFSLEPPPPARQSSRPAVPSGSAPRAPTPLVSGLPVTRQPKELALPAVSESRATIRGLYLLAGPARPGDVASFLHEFALRDGFDLSLRELDVCRSPLRDLSCPSFQETLVSEPPVLHFVIASPPCSSWL